MRQPIKGSSAPLSQQKGISLIETVLALALIGIVGIAFLQALRTTSFSAGNYEAWVTASNLAQSQLEEIKAAAYDLDAASKNPAYPLSVDPPASYSISVSAVQLVVGTPEVAGKQEVTVVVWGGGNSLIRLSTIKTDR